MASCMVYGTVKGNQAAMSRHGCKLRPATLNCSKGQQLPAHRDLHCLLSVSHRSRSDMPSAGWPCAAQMQTYRDCDDALLADTLHGASYELSNLPLSIC